MTARVRVASIHDLAPGTGKEIVAAGRIVALFNVGGDFRAIDGICAHAGGPVGKGVLKGCVVTCPWHGWQYDVTTGTSCLNPRIGQEAFQVTVEGDDVFVEVTNPVT
jgi:nitrite reductase (NADH) small subunit